MGSALTALALALAVAGLPAAVHAQQLANTAKWVNLRAGPDRSYPVVAQLAPNVQVTVYGCLTDYRWCDVTVGPQRGWVYAGNLVYPYQGNYAPLIGIGAIVGIGVLAFILDDYWGQHYRDRSFYGQRYRWAHPTPHPVPPRVVPTPHPVPPRVAPAPHPGVRPAPQPRPRPQPRREQPHQDKH